MQEINILAIVGSLRKQSYNYQLAQVAQQLCPENVHITILDYHDIPYMNEDNEYPTPLLIHNIRQQIMKVDGVWFFTPEYNHSYPGVLKNLIDWLSRPDELGHRVLNQKPVAISGLTIGMSGTAIVQDQLVTLLSFLNMNIMNTPRLTIPNALEQIQDGKLILTTSLPFLKNQLQAFIHFIDNNKRAQ